jgi:S-(hydroxymethyl)glutathione dehydrogenase / alcohol dehydrogenase
MPEIPKTMRAAILVQQQAPLVVDEVRLPETLGVGQVLVRIFFSGVCGSQLGEIGGVKGPDPYLPHLLGHEGSGEVLAAGPGVSKVKAGDRVVLHWVEGRGLAAAPPVYTWSGRRLNAGLVTTFNEYAVVSENRLTVIPPDFDMEAAPLLGCAVTTGLGVINHKAAVKIGESVVVFGAGGVGLSLVQGAAMVAAHPIVAVDLFDNRLQLAADLGATHTLNAAKTSAEDEVRKIIGQKGADVVVDNTGNPAVIEAACRLTSPVGRTILVGVPRKGDNISLYTLPLHFGKTLTGTKGGETDPDVDIPRYVRLFQAGKLKIRELVTDRFPLAEINTALEQMRSGAIAGRCLIDMQA